jgi:hypothetical protein
MDKTENGSGFEMFTRDFLSGLVSDVDEMKNEAV